MRFVAPHRVHALLPLSLSIALVGAAGRLCAQQPAASAPTAAAAATASDPAFESAFQVFSKAADGDKDAVQPAVDAFGALSRAQPTDPVLLAYAGASTAMLSTTTMLPWRKMGHAEDGLAMQDKALALLSPGHDAPGRRHVPATLETRFVAANTFLRLPSMFNRHARGEKLLAEVLHSPLFGASPLPFRATVWMRAAAEAADAKRMDEARGYWKQVVDNGAPQADAARAKLKELGA